MSVSYVIFSARYAPQLGGVESFTRNLAHFLVMHGDSVCVVSNRIGNSPECEVQADGVRVIRLPCHPLLNGRLPLSRPTRRQHELLGYIDNVDRVLINTRLYGHSLIGLKFAKTRNAAAVVLDHGSDYLTFGSCACLDWCAHRYEHFITWLDKLFVPTFAGISLKSVEWLETFGIKTDHVIPNAIDAVTFRSEKTGRDFRAEIGCGNRCLVVASGRLTREKGPDRLAHIARLLGNGWQFAWAGDGPMRQVLESDLPDNMVLLGNLQHPDLSALLSQADIFCLPTRSEGFCTSLLEAGAWGLPCVIPNVGGAHEVLCSDGVTYGAIMANREPEAIAAALRKVRSAWPEGHVKALSKHVECACSWEASAQALDLAFLGH